MILIELSNLPTETFNSLENCPNLKSISGNEYLKIRVEERAACPSTV